MPLPVRMLNNVHLRVLLWIASSRPVEVGEPIEAAGALQHARIMASQPSIDNSHCRSLKVVIT